MSEDPQLYTEGEIRVNRAAGGKYRRHQSIWFLLSFTFHILRFLKLAGVLSQSGWSPRVTLSSVGSSASLSQSLAQSSTPLLLSCSAPRRSCAGTRPPSSSSSSPCPTWCPACLQCPSRRSHCSRRRSSKRILFCVNHQRFSSTATMGWSCSPRQPSQ